MAIGLSAVLLVQYYFLVGMEGDGDSYIRAFAGRSINADIATDLSDAFFHAS